MFSSLNAEKATIQLNNLLAAAPGNVPEYEKFNVQFLGNDVDFSIDTDDETASDFVNPCAIPKLSINARRVLNYIHYHHIDKHGKLRKIKEQEIASELNIAVKTVNLCKKKLVQTKLIECCGQSKYRLTFEVRDDKNYFYINKFWFTETWDFDIEIDGVTYTINRRLPVEAVFTLCTIARNYAYQNKYFKSSQRNLAKFLNCSPATAGNTFRHLESSGLMHRVFIKDGKNFDCLGVNGSWQTNFIINEEITKIAKNTQDSAANRTVKYTKYDKPRDRSSEERIAAFTLSISAEQNDQVSQYAKIYQNRVIERCKNDITFQQITQEKETILAEYERGDLTEREVCVLLERVLRRQRAYLKQKGLPKQSLEFNYQARRAKRYLTSNSIKPKIKGKRA